MSLNKTDTKCLYITVFLQMRIVATTVRILYFDILRKDKQRFRKDFVKKKSVSN